MLLKRESCFHKISLTVWRVSIATKKHFFSFENFCRLKILKMFWYVRANQAFFVNKRINKEILKGSHLRNNRPGFTKKINSFKSYVDWKQVNINCLTVIIEEVILDDFDIKRHLEYILREQNKNLTLKKNPEKKLRNWRWWNWWSDLTEN